MNILNLSSKTQKKTFQDELENLSWNHKIEEIFEDKWNHKGEYHYTETVGEEVILRDYKDKLPHHVIINQNEYEDDFESFSEEDWGDFLGYELELEQKYYFDSKRTENLSVEMTFIPKIKEVKTFLGITMLDLKFEFEQED